MITVGAAQAATPLVFWWLDAATVYALGLALSSVRSPAGVRFR